MSTNNKVALVQSQVEEVRNVMVGNIDKVLQNQESLHLLSHKTHELSHSANIFQRSSKHVKKSFKSKHICIIILTLVIIAIAIIIVGLII